jgi:hypothetical protein
VPPRIIRRWNFIIHGVAFGPSSSVALGE